MKALRPSGVKCGAAVQPCCWHQPLRRSRALSTTTSPPSYPPSCSAPPPQNAARQEEIQKALEGVGEDMDAMSALLDELQELTNQSQDLDVALIDKKIDQVGG